MRLTLAALLLCVGGLIALAQSLNPRYLLVTPDERAAIYIVDIYDDGALVRSAALAGGFLHGPDLAFDVQPLLEGLSHTTHLLRVQPKSATGQLGRAATVAFFWVPEDEIFAPQNLRLLSDLPILAPPPAPEPRSWYASFDGSGVGTEVDPWSLHVALSSLAVAPGDQIFLSGCPVGVRDGCAYMDQYISTISGSVDRPIDIRPRLHPERVTFDPVHIPPGKGVSIGFAFGQVASLVVRGRYTRWWDLDFRSTNTPRRQERTAETFWGNSARPGGVFMQGDHNLFIHSHFFDTGWAWIDDPTVQGNRVYGSVMGWNGFIKNDGTQYGGTFITSGTIVDSTIITGSLGHGIRTHLGSGVHVPEPGTVITVRDSIITTAPAGSLADPALVQHMPSAPVVLGRLQGDKFAHITLTGTVAYADDSIIESTLFASECDVHDNYLIDGLAPFRGGILATYGCAVRRRTNNVLWPSLRWDGNVTYPLVSGPPTTNFVRVRPATEFDAKRGMIAIANWENRDSVDVDLSSVGFEVGDRIQIRDPLNWRARLLTTTYTGQPVTIPLTDLPVERPVGSDLLLPSHTAPRFAALVTCLTHHEP